MSDQSLADFFSGVRMTQLMGSESVKGGIPDPLPKSLSTPSSNKPVGMEVTWEDVKGDRNKAVAVHHLSPAQRITVQGVTRKFATAVGVKIEFTIDAELIMKLKSDQPIIAESAKRELVRRVKLIRSRCDNWRVHSRFAAFSKGSIWIDKDGKLLASSSGALITIPFGVPSTLNKNSTTDGVTIGDWSSAATDIPTSLKALRTGMFKRNGYNPTTILYGKSIPSYLAGNTLVQAYLARNPGMNNQFLTTNEIPDGLLGYKWLPMELAYDAETSTSWWADNQLTLLPDVSEDWYEYIEAGTLVPKGLGDSSMSPDQALNMWDVVNGYFSYVVVSQNPIGINVIGGDYTLPTIKVGDVVQNVTVS